MDTNGYVGQFMYNQQTDTLYKYELVEPELLEYYYSEMLKHIVKRNKTLHKDIMTEDDLKHCRGRVFYYKDSGFKIVVGHWIYDYPYVVGKIIDTFHLPYDTKVIIHKHWDIKNNVDLK